jgi:DNA invertase Pin-like site-specific DNA recombinase
VTHFRTPNDAPEPRGAKTFRGAEYVRMSTEHQKYSTENQGEAIARYAAQRGIEIVRTYADHGKSGLRLDGRDALKRLIRDVQSGPVDFSAILVYDVSRWGRFQDADESAYYEFICKEAGIAVHYCAEQFENDGSLSATIIKSMKRAMAGEYSRELSAKVFAGQCRLIGLGFRQGGIAGFGLRRQLIDEERRPKCELSIGSQKSLQTDRVVLIPGPEREISTVRRVYRLFIDEDRTEREIAGILNSEKETNGLGRSWTRGTVHQLLTNEKYIGNNVYNRTSFKLKKKRVANPPDMWVRADGVFAAVVDTKTFQAAQHLIEKRSRRFTDDEMLGRLAALLTELGWLSGVIIDEREDMPSSSAYRTRFGSLLRAYKLIGYSAARDYAYVETNRVLRAMHPEVVSETVATIERLGGTIRRDPISDLLTVNDEFTASIVVSRCFRTAAGALRWRIRLDTSFRPDITVALRMDTANRGVLDYYLLPRIDIGDSRLGLAEENGLSLDGYRYDSLEAFFRLAARSPIRGAA